MAGFNTMVLWTIIVISIISVATFGFMAAIYTDVGKEAPEELEGPFNRFDEANALYNQTQTIIDQGDINPLGFGLAVFKSVIIAAKTMMSSIGVLATMVTFGLPTYIGIPPAITGMLVTMLFIGALIGFIVYISGRTP